MDSKTSSPEITIVTRIAYGEMIDGEKNIYCL